MLMQRARPQPSMLCRFRSGGAARLVGQPTRSVGGGHSEPACVVRLPRHQEASRQTAAVAAAQLAPHPGRLHPWTPWPMHVRPRVCTLLTLHVLAAPACLRLCWTPTLHLLRMNCTQCWTPVHVALVAASQRAALRRRAHRLLAAPMSSHLPPLVVARERDAAPGTIGTVTVSATAFKRAEA